MTCDINVTLICMARRIKFLRQDIMGQEVMYQIDVTPNKPRIKLPQLMDYVQEHSCEHDMFEETLLDGEIVELETIPFMKYFSTEKEFEVSTDDEDDVGTYLFTRRVFLRNPDGKTIENIEFVFNVTILERPTIYVHN